MPGAHGEEVPDSHGLEIPAGFFRAVRSQVFQHRIFHAQQSLSDGQANRGRGKAFAERIQLVRGFRVIWPPPTLGHHMPMSDNHQAVDLFHPVEGVDS